MKVLISITVCDFILFSLAVTQKKVAEQKNSFYDSFHQNHRNYKRCRLVTYSLRNKIKIETTEITI